VDIDNTGGNENGTSASPYNTIGEAIAASVSGQTISIAPGTYDNETFPLYLKAGIILRGESSSTTIIPGQICDSSNSSQPTGLMYLSFRGFSFSRGPANDAPSAFNSVEFCTVTGDIDIIHGGSHRFNIKNNTITGDIDVSHGAGSSINIIKYNTVTGSINLAHGDCSNDSICQNTIAGGDIYDRSGQCNTVISGNTVAGGRIIDRSGNGQELIAGNTITFSPQPEDDDSVGLISSGLSATIVYNQITVSSGGGGVLANSGSPTIIDSNTIVVNGTGIAMKVYSGSGEIVGNNIIGGFIGIYDRSGASVVAYNTISGSQTGVYTSGAGKYHHNIISGCSGDGMVLHGVRGPVEADSIVYNGGAGIRITTGSPDLGGGADSCNGDNVIRNNAGGDLINETDLLIKAENNYWDHQNAGEIDEYDIIDDDENAARGQVDFQPFH
jgi:hypothetical protein